MFSFKKKTLTICGFLQIHVCGHPESHPAVSGVHDWRSRAAGEWLYPHHWLEQLHLQAGIQTDPQHAAAGYRGASGNKLHDQKPILALIYFFYFFRLLRSSVNRELILGLKNVILFIQAFLFLMSETLLWSRCHYNFLLSVILTDGF